MIPNGLPGAGTRDDSAFTTEMDPRGIQPGTAIVTWIKRTGDFDRSDRGYRVVRYRDFWGTAAWKAPGADRELAQRGHRILPDAAPTYEEHSPERRRPLASSRRDVMEGGFEAWPALDELFSYDGSGCESITEAIEGSVIETQMRACWPNGSQTISRTPTFAAASAAFSPDLAPSYPASDGKLAQIVGYEPEAVWDRRWAASVSISKAL